MASGLGSGSPCAGRILPSVQYGDPQRHYVAAMQPACADGCYTAVVRFGRHTQAQEPDLRIRGRRRDRQEILPCCLREPDPGGPAPMLKSKGSLSFPSEQGPVNQGIRIPTTWIL